MKNCFSEEQTGDVNVSIRNTPPLIMNARELSIYLGISERKIRSDAASGKIPYIRIGGRVVFRLCDIDRCLEKLRRGKL